MGMPQVAWERDWRWCQVSYADFSTAPSDYSAVSQEVVFSAGTRQRTVNISIIEDSVLEDVEFFYVRVKVPASHAGVVLLGTDTATISITDDDSKWQHWSAQCLCMPLRGFVVVWDNSKRE